MTDEQTNANAKWWIVIVFLSLATIFIYFLIFQPEAVSLWLRDNLMVSWTALGVAIIGTGLFFFLSAKSSGRRRSLNRIRGTIYCLIGASILLAVSFK
ncbi:MAG: hypothetical protein V2I41_11670 [Pseudomonadales bacterium]|jgi:hypothetical protein|nr:hypothetical protein [Pseudomonadales bacterium]